MDWIRLLEDNHIPYVTRGPNTKRGEISVRCPFCGEDDPSEHLGINLERAAWGCHRNQVHRGKNPLKLIQALLGCSYQQAKFVVAQYDRADPEALGSLEIAPPAPVRAFEAPVMPPEFQPIPDKGRFFEYLKQRGFEEPYWVARAYNLKCCTTGRWKDRIIIPVYHKGDLVAWTGRALQNPISAPRYLSTSEVIKTVIFNEDHIAKGGRCLFITEGPFDAIKVDYHGYNGGAKATAVFGTSITIDQISILKSMAKGFEKVVLLFDDDATETAFNMADWLPNAIIGTLPDGIKDPGELNKQQVQQLVASHIIPTT